MVLGKGSSLNIFSAIQRLTFFQGGCAAKVFSEGAKRLILCPYIKNIVEKNANIFMFG
jgi:hypothetical protein